MSQSLCCCSPCRPTFKRHVDGIYPANPEDGLVKNKMETLVYYAVTSPEKLDRIGEYLETRVGRDIYRNRKKNVVIGMEAMDQVGTEYPSEGFDFMLLLIVESHTFIVQFVAKQRAKLLCQRHGRSIFQNRGSFSNLLTAIHALTSLSRCRTKSVS